MCRGNITNEEIDTSLRRIQKEIDRRFAQKGRGAWLSSDEVRGVIQRELYELDKAIHEKNKKQILDELMDVTVACVFGYTCIINSKTQW